MKYSYKPQGTCSSQIDFEIDNGIVKSVSFQNGCQGNLKGISALVEGMSIDDIVRRLDGIRCGSKSTSCPDQLSRALKAAKEQ